MKIKKENKMKYGKMNKILLFSVVLALLSMSVVVYAGDATRVGTAGGTQLQIPVGGRNIGMAGADLVFTKSLDAVYWNPAGLGDLPLRGAGLFSMENYIADINISYLALGFNISKFGALGVSVKSFDFGDIPITTVEQMDGTGSNYSPTYNVFGLTFARHFTDRINFGVTGKIVYENIPRASASAYAFDLGIQYKDLLSIKGLGIGITMKNIGTNMEYKGTALMSDSRQSGETYDQFLYRPVSSDQLPSSLELGLGYKAALGFGNVLASGTFQHNNFENDQLRFGGEVKMFDLALVRVGYIATLEDPDNKGIGKNAYGLSLGGGIVYNIGGIGLVFDYAYRPAGDFGNNNIFALEFGF